MELSGRGLFKDTTQVFSWRDLRKTRKTSLSFLVCRPRFEPRIARIRFRSLSLSYGFIFNIIVS
jgi:hypothetical protein